MSEEGGCGEGDGEDVPHSAHTGRHTRRLIRRTQTTDKDTQRHKERYIGTCNRNTHRHTKSSPMPENQTNTHRGTYTRTPKTHR